jgi:hypothetical protein
MPVQPDLREDAGNRRETPPLATGASPIARPGWRDWLRNLAIAAAAGVFLALVGAMGTSEAPALMRLVYWIPLMIGGAVIGHALAQLVTRVLRADTNPWLFGVVLSLALSIPVTVMVWAYTNFIFGGGFGLRGIPLTFGPVLVISTAMTAIMIAVHRPGRVTHAPAAGASPPPVRFLERLPPKLKGAVIYAVSAEDHYLRLHTSKGSDLILMRLADAVTELEGLEGAQTHRSWWVAKDAVERAQREGDRVTLTLKSGAEAPISRPNIKPLREAGWF